MHIIMPFIKLYHRHWLLLSISSILAIITLIANIWLLAISGWFLSSAALSIIGMYECNYILPAVGIRMAAIIRTISRYAERLVSHDGTFRVLSHLRVFIFQKLFPLSPAGIINYRQGDILNRLVVDVDTLDHLYLRVISPLVSAIIITALVTYVLSTFNFILAFILCSIMLIILIILPPIFYQAGKLIGQDITILRSKYRVCLLNIIQAHAELTLFGALPRFYQRLLELEKNWLKRQQQQYNLTTLLQSIMIVVTGITITLIMWIAIFNLGDKPKIPGEIIALFVFSTIAALEVLGPVAISFQYLGQVITSASRINELINQQPMVQFPVTGLGLNEITIHSDTDRGKGQGIAIELRNVSFSYPLHQRKILNNISLTINYGEHVAILGKTGCGKSTLLQLLTRAWDVSSGEILINNHAINYYNEETLRKLIAVVPQRTHIFSDTLRNNLLLAKQDASDTLLIEFLQKLDLISLTKNDGLDKWIGEGGRQLSGGEQRRLGIARALLYDAPIILLDEPTEGLDVKTEQNILIQLQQHCIQKTLLIITHRLQKVNKLDTIYIIDNGRLLIKQQI